MEVINILRHNGDATAGHRGPLFFQQGQSSMGGIGLNVTVEMSPTPHIVEFLNPLWVAGIGFGRCNIFDADFGPQSSLVAKRIEAGFLADTCTG